METPIELQEERIDRLVVISGTLQGKMELLRRDVDRVEEAVPRLAVLEQRSLDQKDALQDLRCKIRDLRQSVEDLRDRLTTLVPSLKSRNVQEEPERKGIWPDLRPFLIGVLSGGIFVTLAEIIR